MRSAEIDDGQPLAAQCRGHAAPDRLEGAQDGQATHR